MPHVRKADHCLNCGSPLAAEDNFCRLCGQENDNRNTSFTPLAKEFIDEALNIDGRLAASVVPFLFRPGSLTLAFIGGQRQRYVQPLRLYLSMSVVFFILLAFITDRQADKLDDRPGNPKLSAVEKRLADSTTFEQKKAAKLRLLDSTLKQDLDPEERQEIKAERDSILIRHFKPKSDKFTISFGDTRLSLSVDEKLFKGDSIADSSYLDSAGWAHNWFTLRIIKQSRKIARAETGAGRFGMVTFMVENASLAAFLMVPLLALFLRFLYWRRRTHYIVHLVHVLYFQSFVFFAATLIYGSAYVVEWQGWSENWAVSIQAFLTIATILYALGTLKSVYGQGWPKTLLKTFLALLAYLVSLLIVVVPLTLFSFLLF